MSHAGSTTLSVGPLFCLSLDCRGDFTAHAHSDHLQTDYLKSKIFLESGLLRRKRERARLLAGRCEHFIMLMLAYRSKHSCLMESTAVKSRCVCVFFSYMKIKLK